MPPHLKNVIDPVGTRRTNNHHLSCEYNAQTSNKRNHNRCNHVIDNNDQHSASGGSVANSVATPSSVYMPSSVALSRDNMSDLSGISGERGSSSHKIPRHILDPNILTRPWKQAYRLSNIPPESSKKKTTSRIRTEVNSDSTDNNSGPSIWVAQNDVVEIFDNLESSLGLDRFEIMGRKHNRVPLMILLMDPPKQSYELMQIWVDFEMDSVRDLVQILQHKLPFKWKQAYDGLFQVRGNRFTQLIHIIRLARYDMQPYEILIAKPWSMAAKTTIAIAGSLIRQLTRIGIITVENENTWDIEKERLSRRRQQARNEDTPLLLSKRAQDRTYFPEGILDHHHAVQYITFSPPFDFDEGDHPHTKTKSINFDGQNERNVGMLTLGIRRVIAGPLSRRQKSLARNGPGGGNDKEGRDYLPPSGIGILSNHEQKQVHDNNSNCGPVRCLSKLNCLRNSNNDTTPLTSTQTFTTSLSKEAEKRWIDYGMKPINEDQSLANESIISMSAPLLSP